MQLSKHLLVLLSLTFIWFGCEQSEYGRMLKRELASGIRHDSLFLDIHFGMERQAFYDRCQVMNQQQLVKEGPRNMTVEYAVDGFQLPAAMNFYPEFTEDKISEMPVLFSYKSWAPWNKKTSSDSLMLEVLPLMEEWYGTGFLTVEAPDGYPAYVKVDGNRRMLITRHDDQHVKVLFTDMTVEKEEVKK